MPSTRCRVRMRGPANFRGAALVRRPSREPRIERVIAVDAEEPPRELVRDRIQAMVYESHGKREGAFF